MDSTVIATNVFTKTTVTLVRCKHMQAVVIKPGICYMDLAEEFRKQIFDETCWVLPLRLSAVTRLYNRRRLLNELYTQNHLGKTNKIWIKRLIMDVCCSGKDT